MKTENNGGNAFPEGGTNEWGDANSVGMTLRDYFAAKALQGFCANPAVFSANGITGWSLVNCTDAQLADYCGCLADAMLAARAA